MQVVAYLCARPTTTASAFIMHSVMKARGRTTVSPRTTKNVRVVENRITTQDCS
jgi:hypothetical protein